MSMIPLFALCLDVLYILPCSNEVVGMKNTQSNKTGRFIEKDNKLRLFKV